MPANKPYHYQPAGDLVVATTGFINALDVEGCALVLMSNATTATIRGIGGGFPGQRLTLVAIGAGSVALAHQDGNALAPDRLLNASGGTVTLALNEATAYQYDVTAARWRQVQGASTQIAPGAIMNVHVNAAAAIAWTKLDKTGALLSDLGGTVGAGNMPAFTGGDVTSSAGSVNLQIAAGAILNADVNASAAIAWTKIDKTGSSLADLTTRSAGDLSSGTLLAARMPALTGGDVTASAGSVNLQIAAGAIADADVNAAAAIAWTKLSKAGASLADLPTRLAADLQTGTTSIPYASGNFASSSGTVTVPGAGFVDSWYTNVSGQEAQVYLEFDGATTTGTPGYLTYKLPASWMNGRRIIGLCHVINGAGWGIGTWWAVAGETTIRIYAAQDFGGTVWTSAGNIHVKLLATIIHM